MYDICNWTMIKIAYSVLPALATMCYDDVCHCSCCCKYTFVGRAENNVDGLNNAVDMISETVSLLLKSMWINKYKVPSANLKATSWNDLEIHERGHVRMRMGAYARMRYECAYTLACIWKDLMLMCASMLVYVCMVMRA